MSEVPTVEARLTALEKEVTDLKRQLSLVQDPTNWLQRVSGSFKDQPEFDEMLRLALQIREENRQRAAP